MSEIDEIDAPINFTPHEDIVAAVSSFELADQIDMALLSQDQQEKIYEIKMMCIDIIYIGIKEIYLSNFYASQDNEPPYS